MAIPRSFRTSTKAETMKWRLNRADTAIREILTMAGLGLSCLILTGTAWGQECPDPGCGYICTPSPDHNTSGTPPALPIWYSVVFDDPKHGCASAACLTCISCTVSLSVSFNGQGGGSCISIAHNGAFSSPVPKYVRPGILTTICGGTPDYLIIRFGDCAALPGTATFEEYYILNCGC